MMNNDQPHDEAVCQPTRRRGRSRRVLLATAVAAGTTLAGIGTIGVGASPARAIVDGEPTTAANNPWQVALTGDGEQFCGGSLVSDRIVVTAAHCVVGTPASEIQIRAGVTDLSTNGGQTRNVVTVIEQPKYVSGTGDIAMLVLDRPFDTSPNIGTIAPATAAEIDSASTATVSGWGVTNEHGDNSPSVLQTAEVPLVDDATCAPLGIDNDDELCAGGTGTDSCYGDSGGPLVVQSDRGPVLAGVVSWGEECGGESPGVYAEVPTFADWIAERVGDPDAPGPERLPADAGEFDEFDEGDLEDWFDEGEFDDGTWDEIDAMTDEEFDEYLDAMTDEEFDDFLDGLGDSTIDDGGWWETDGGWTDEVAEDGGAENTESDDEQGDDEQSDSEQGDDGTDAWLDEIDAMSDEEIDDYIDSMTDDQFDDFLDRLDNATSDDTGSWGTDDGWTDDGDVGEEAEQDGLDDDGWTFDDWTDEFDDWADEGFDEGEFDGACEFEAALDG